MKIGRIVSPSYSYSTSSGFGTLEYFYWNSFSRFLNEMELISGGSSPKTITFSSSTSYPCSFCILGSGAHLFSYPNITSIGLDSISLSPAEVDLTFFGGQSLKEKINDRNDLLICQDLTLTSSISRVFSVNFSPVPPASDLWTMDFSFLHFGYWLTSFSIPYDSITWTPETRQFECKIGGFTNNSLRVDLENAFHSSRNIPILFFDDYQVLEHSFNFQLVILQDWRFSIRRGDVWSCDLSGFAI